MTDRATFEVPVVVELDRSIIKDDTDNMTGLRRILTNSYVGIEPTTDFGAGTYLQGDHDGRHAQVEELIGEFRSVPAEEATLKVLEETVAEERTNRKKAIERIYGVVGREKAESALGGLATGVFLGGGAAGILKGITEGKTSWFVLGGIISVASGIKAVINDRRNRAGEFYERPVEKEIYAFETVVEKRQMRSLVLNKLQARRSQLEASEVPEQ